MVRVDEVAWDKARKSAAHDRGGLTQYDRDLIGRAVRIEIPFTDPKLLLEIADKLRSFANTIEFTVQREDMPLRARLFLLKSEAMAINAVIRERRKNS